MNPSYKRRLCGILAAACMLTAATVPAVSPIFSQVTLSATAAEETDFYRLEIFEIQGLCRNH